MAERVEHLHAEMRGLRRRERPKTVRQIVERLATDELHDHHEFIIVMVELVDRRDTWMVQAGERNGFGAEPFEEVRVRGRD
jgi:hypothetical protein